MTSNIHFVSQYLSELEQAGVLFSVFGKQIRYTAPPSFITSAHIKFLQMNKAASVLYLQARSSTNSLLAVGDTVTRDGSRPAPSHSQQLWWRAYGGSEEGRPITFNIGLIKRYAGIKITAVKDAIHQILKNHRVLQSRFNLSAGELSLSFNLLENFDILIEDLENQLGGEITLKVGYFVSEMIPILDSWLVRAKIFRVANEQLIVALAINHIIFDGGSRAILSAELDAILEHSSRENSVTTDFYDYSAMESSLIDGEAGSYLRSYWRERARCRTVLLSPRTSRPLVWCPGSRVSYPFKLSSELTSALATIANLLKVTPFVVYLALYILTIREWSSCGSFAVRCLSDRRTCTGTARTVGLMYCADTLDLDITEKTDFDSIARLIQSEYMMAISLRLPTIQYFPPHIAGIATETDVVINDIPAAISFRPLGAGHPRKKNNAGFAPIAFGQPSMQRWSRPISPLFLVLAEHTFHLNGVIQFNDEFFPLEEQSRFISLFRKVLTRLGSNGSNPKFFAHA